MASSVALQMAKRVTHFVLIVATFAMLGPVIGAFVMSLAMLVIDSVRHGLTVNTIYASFVLSLILAYPIGIKSAVLAGAIVAAAGIFLKQNSLLVAAIAGIAASLLYWFMEYPTGTSTNIFFGIFALLCMFASAACWYVTRGIVRATWPTV
jgi:hypothetical protein